MIMFHNHAKFHACNSVQVDPTSSDDKEKLCIEKFITYTCVCHLWNGGSCSSQFKTQHVQEVHLTCAVLSHSELDMVILG